MDIIIPQKRCSKCEKEFPATPEYFHRLNDASDGFYSSCKQCRKQGKEPQTDRVFKCPQCHKVYSLKLDPAFVLCKSCQRRRYKLHLYGLSEQEYQSLVTAQQGACKICGHSGKKLHIDHDHSTGKVRGLLCGPCNRGLGLFKDNPVSLRNAANYLEQ